MDNHLMNVMVVDYERALINLSNNTRRETNTEYEPLKFKNQCIYISTDEINEITKSIKSGSENRSYKIIDKLFEQFYYSADNNFEHVRPLSVCIATAVINCLTEWGPDTKDVFKSKILPYNQLLKLRSLDEIKKYLKELSLHVISHINNTNVKKKNKIFEDIADYINKNISDSRISLSKVANTFYLNPSYLSRAFKQVIGLSFVEYLTRARIDMALSLFKSTDLRGYEVCEKIGIPDPNYFGKCFKKYTGMSVIDYKKVRCL